MTGSWSNPNTSIHSIPVPRRCITGTRDDRNHGGVSFTPADGVVASGHDWDWVLWNPDTGEYRDMETSE